MCGRFVSFMPPEAVHALFRALNPVVNHAASWNVAPTQPALVVRRHPATGARHLDRLHWGLVPHFTTDLKAARKPINARSETAATMGLFRGALAARRCLIPADAFYEWRTMPDGKQPYAIARRDGTPAVFAGIWEGWRTSDGEALRTFAILTTRANATMAALHKRMPVILDPDDWPLWLGETGSQAGDEAGGKASTLLRPAPDDALHLWLVSRAVNSVRNDGATLLDRVDFPAAPPASEALPGANPA